jgi:ATP-dependent Zn protease
VSEVGVSDRYLQGKLKEPLPNGKSQFVTTRVDPQFADELQKYDVTYTGEVGSTLLQDLLSWILPAVLFFGVWMFLSRRITQGLGGGLMSIGESKAKIYVESDTGVRFSPFAKRSFKISRAREDVSWTEAGRRMDASHTFDGPRRREAAALGHGVIRLFGWRRRRKHSSQR